MYKRAAKVKPKKNCADCLTLKGLLVAKQITYKALAQKLGISENSLTLKINGQRYWWYWEVAIVFNLLKNVKYNTVEDVFPELCGLFVARGA